VLNSRLRNALLILTASVGLSGCATYGLGGGYGGYGGYGGVSVGYGNGYYDPYYDGYGSRYAGYGYGSPYGYGYGSPYGYGGYGYGSPYFGWYDNFYYPGVGYYVYNRSGNRYRWTDAQRRYWESRRPRTNVVVRENWTGYRPTDRRTGDIIARRDASRAAAQQRTVERRTYRAERRDDRQEARSERRSDRVQTRTERRRSRRD
jgi:hypothetical protein